MTLRTTYVIHTLANSRFFLLCSLDHLQMFCSLKEFIKKDIKLQTPDVQLIRLIDLTGISWNPKTWALSFDQKKKRQKIMLLMIYSFVFFLVLVSVEKIYQTRKTVFDHISNHLKVRQKYPAVRRIFNSLLGDWKCGFLRREFSSFLPLRKTKTLIAGYTLVDNRDGKSF